MLPTPPVSPQAGSAQRDFVPAGCRAGDDIRSPVARQSRPSRMAGIPAQVGEQGVSPAPGHQTGRRVPGPDRRVGSAPGLRPELRREAQARRRVGSVWQALRDVGPGDTRRATVPGAAPRGAMVRSCKAPVSQPRCRASPWPEICADPAAPGMTSLTRCTAAKGTYKWILQSNADGCHLSGTAACAAPGRASFCLLRCTLRLLQARAATDQAAVCIRTDSRSELACDAFRCGGCCTLLLYEAPEPCDQAFELWSLSWCGAMGIRTPDLLHAMKR